MNQPIRTTFKRKALAADKETVVGVRNWTNSQRLLSLGIKELDVGLGGGIPLNSSTLIEMDYLSCNGKTIMNYALAESICSGHTTVIIDWIDDYADYAAELKRNLPFETSAVYSVESNAKETGDELSNAIQYRKYLTSDGNQYGSSMSSSFSSSNWCHSYDLSRSMQDSIFACNKPILVDCRSSLYSLISHLKSARTSQIPCRIFFLNLHHWLVDHESLVKISRIIQISIAMQNTCLVASVCPFSLPQAMRDKIQVAFNCIISIESFNPANFMKDLTRTSYESFKALSQYRVVFDELICIIRVIRTSNQNSFHPNHCSSLESVFGVKRDRRRITIAPLHIPPLNDEEDDDDDAGEEHEESVVAVDDDDGEYDVQDDSSQVRRRRGAALPCQTTII